tara:strand:+ start:925 stop:1695 length:771 start_codon:yes stop_codon:yes gene_type:complete
MRLIIFGDSFAQPYEQEWIWYRQTAQKLDCDEIINYAIQGSSLEYSLSKLVGHIATDLQEQDKIIFLTTIPIRAPIVHEKYLPEWACLYNMDVLADKNIHSTAHEHFEQHKQYYKSHALFAEYNISLYKHLPLIATCNMINNDVVCMMMFDVVPAYIRKLVTKKNLIIPDMFLYDVSANELDQQNMPALFNKLGIGDMRPCHLTRKNHDVLAEAMAQSLTQKKDCFNVDSFHQKILNKNNVHKFFSEWNKMFERNQ